jgi:hypothetical protein
MSYFGKLRGILVRLILLIGFVITPLISIRSWVSAQGSSAPLWVVRSLYTSEYGVNEPKGLAFSSMANTFLILDGSANAALVSMGEDNLGIRNLPGIQNDPLNVAFDDQTGSLFEFNRGMSELTEFRADDKGLPDVSAPPTHFAVNAFGIKEALGITFGSDDGRLFILDAGNLQIVSVVPHPTLGLDANEAIRSNKVERISLKKLGIGPLKGIAYNLGNGHFYVSEPAQKRLYELTQAGDLVSVFDLAALGINDPSAMTFAPSGDTTDDPNTMDLYVLDAGQTAQKAESLFHFASTVSMQGTASSSSQIVELSLVAPAVLPAGTTLLPATLVHTFDTSTWSNPSPDPSGVDYWPATGQLLISDSEVEESVAGNPPVYWHGYNVFLSTLSGSLAGNCTTFTSSPVGLTYNNFSDEPTGVAINPNNNHIFFSDDGTNSRISEIGPGPDGVYCTSDDTVTKISVTNLYGATDAEDVAYGNNTLYEADGINAEVYVIPLGADGVISGDDGPMTHWDTAVLGFHDLEGIGYNADSGTLFIASPEGSENYLGEVTTSGTLIHVYDLSFMGTAYNLRSDVAYAPSSQNPAVKDIYIVSRGVDNNTNRFENDGKVWEISISNPATSVPTVLGVVRANSNPTNASNVNFTVTFSEPVTGVDITDFALSTTGGISGASIANLSGSGQTYTIIVNTGSSDGTIRLDVLNDHSIMDAASNTLSSGFTSGETYTVMKSAALVNVNIGGSLVHPTYTILLHSSTRDSYSGVNNGPVEIISTNGIPIIGAERVIYKIGGIPTSFSEMMGLPNSQLDTTYWMPWYNNVDLDTQLRIGNVSGTTATIHVSIGGTEMTSGCLPSNSPYTLAPGASLRVSCMGINNGPAKIESNVNIVAAERVIYKVNNIPTSFSEMMALPNSQLNTTYWLPWYNNVDLDTQLRFGNVSGSTATVHVYIGGSEMTSGCKPSNSPFTLAAGGSLRVSCTGKNNGPVRIVSDQNIVAAERVIYKVNNTPTSFSETMALSNGKLNTAYWLPWYNNVDLDTQLRFGNVTTNQTATVHVLIGGQEMTSGCTPSNSPYTLTPGASLRINCSGVNNGPVKILSNVNIVAAERVIYKVNNIPTSFSEMMALPNSQLNTTYWLPWYNNITLDTQLRFGIP